MSTDRRDEVTAVPFNLRADAYAGTTDAYVRFRVPYPPDLLAHLRRCARISGAGRLLDLGCGPGRVALPLAPFFREVWAVDREPEMLAAGRAEAARRGVANVRWMLGRAEDVEVPTGSMELVTMGEAFHRFDQPVVLRQVVAWLQSAGWVAALGGVHPWQNGWERWQRRLQEVWERWVPAGAAAAHPAARQPVLTSGQIFAGAGFEDVRGDEFSVCHVWTVESLLGYASSTSVLSRQALGEQAGAFAEDVRRTLLACDSRNAYPARVRFWCAVGRRPPEALQAPPPVQGR
jgi:SAM-dependent methyltransferase